MDAYSRPILVVEDDENDVFFLKYAFESAEIRNPLSVVSDGQQAIDYLSGAGNFSDRSRFPFPWLVLLDLKLPIKMGMDVLRWIRQEPSLATLLVVVLTSSSDSREIAEAYRCGARSFLVKPLSVEKRLDMAKAIKHYWIELNQAPQEVEP